MALLPALQTGEYVFNILMWNERLLQQAQAAEAKDEQQHHSVSVSKIKDRFKGLLSGW